jgi:hypothetical protein
MIEFPEGLEPVSDLTPTRWLQAEPTEERSGPLRVRHLVPPSFEAYARILHQTQRADRDRLRTGTWAERAAELEVRIGPETSWREMLDVASFEGEGDAWAPDIGRLSEEEVSTVAALLENHTADPAACWFGLWTGFGFLTPGGVGYLRALPVTLRERWAMWMIRREERKVGREAERALRGLPTFPLLGARDRAYLLFGGAVSDATRFMFHGWFQSPTLWWSDDRSWFVHTEIDAMSTYLGGSRQLVEELVGQQILESFEVAADDRAAL